MAIKRKQTNRNLVTVIRLAVICFVIYSLYNHYQNDDRFLLSLWWAFSILNGYLFVIKREKEEHS